MLRNLLKVYWADHKGPQVLVKVRRNSWLTASWQGKERKGVIWEVVAVCVVAIVLLASPFQSTTVIDSGNNKM
jgi:hypothetical protein